MDYRKIYLNLVMSRQLLDRKKLSKDNLNYIYYEKHHILPRSLSGTNLKENLVLLTAREHFIAHLLLTKCYESKEKRKMVHGLWKMCHDRWGGRIISASQYEYARREWMTLGNWSWSKPVIQFSLTGEKIAEFNSVTEAKRKIGSGAIYDCLSGKSRIAGGYYWCFKEKEKEFIAKKYFHMRARQIIQLSLTNEVIKIWPSFREIRKIAKLGKYFIVKCLTGEIETYGGFKWLENKPSE